MAEYVFNLYKLVIANQMSSFKNKKMFNMTNKLSRLFFCKTKRIIYKNNLINGYCAQHSPQSAIVDEDENFLVIK